MVATDEGVENIPQLFYQALPQVMLGNVGPMLALWSEREDVSYCDPEGKPHQGHAGLVAYWERAARLNGEDPGSISVTAELLVMQRSESLICAFMNEHIRIRQGNQVLQMQARGTNIYRYEEGQWRMVHRHSGSPTEEK